MPTDRPAKEAKHEKQHQINNRETETAQPEFSEFSAASTLHSDQLRRADVLALQRLVGNRSIQRLISPVVQTGLNPSRPKHVLQRYGSLEHKELGDKGSGGLEYDFQDDGSITKANPADNAADIPFRLTHGDITMLSGDYFDPRDNIVFQDDDPGYKTDSLLTLASIPSSDPGKMPGTRDEIIFAIYDINPKDPRFSKDTDPKNPTNGIWGNIEFSEEVKKAVNDRYLRLAANNREHFVAPEGTDKGPGAGMGKSAGGSYRALHEDAVLLAYDAGLKGEDIGEALAHEAAAHHFLTDHFAAGHIRTPRESIRQHWRKLYPLFFSNLKKKIAHEVAVHINANTTNAATIFGTVSQIYDTVYSEVLKKTEDLPELGFDDLVSMVAHDLDNETGVWVVNDLGDRWKTFGDGNLHNSENNKNNPMLNRNRTPEIAQRAVQWGNEDIRNAYELGTAHPQNVTLDWVLETIRLSVPAGAMQGDKYAPEQLLPHLDTQAEQSKQNWQTNSLGELWDMPVRSDQPAKTYGVCIQESLEKGELNKKLTGMASQFDKNQRVPETGIYLGTVHPQAAFLEGFFEPLKSNPRLGLQSIIDLNLSQGQAFFNEDDAVMEEIHGTDSYPGMTDEQLKGLTLNQRADRIKELIGAGDVFNWTAEDEGETVIKLFETANDKMQLYRLIEGHAWTGDWKHGVFTSDDELWNSLSRSQLKRLREIINGK